MAGNFLINRLKEKFKDDEDDEDGFPDMNYLIGNSSAMDVGEVPTPMDERIGYASQVGGKVMELQITNPATFELEREAMIKTINQLGLDITLHPDMNAGFCTAEKSARGEEYGYETVEQYFTNYLQELAQFKKHVEKLGDGNQPLFNIGRMNPHISTSPKPSLAERMANDVGLDPFGFEIADGDKEAMKARSYDGKNIWENEEFLRRVYYTFFVEEVDFAFQYYGMFSRYSEEFEEIWNEAQRKATNKFYTHRTEETPESLYQQVQEKIKALRTAERQDRGIETEWLDILDNKKIKFPKFEIYVNSEVSGGSIDNIEIDEVKEKEEKLIGLNELGDQFRRLGTLSQTVHNLKNGEDIISILIQKVIEDVEIIDEGNDLSKDMIIRNAGEEIEYKIQQKLLNIREEINSRIYSELISGFNELWGVEREDEDKITVDAKIAALDNHYDIEGRRIQEIAYEEGVDGDETLDTHAEKVFMGDSEYYTSEGPEKDLELDKHHELLKNLMQNFEQEMWKESNLFYKIIPAWMSVSSEVQNDNHSGWDAPEFIWKVLIEDRWGERDDVDLDLKNPRNGIYEEDGDEIYHFLDLLEESDEFQRDVCAAVGACYAWGHYTQRKAQFDLKGRDFGLSDEEIEEVQNEGWTWIRWMNKFGLGVNLETMAGSPQMRFKVWRPKDIAVTAHAINMTTREIFDEEELNDEIDGRPAKFTIDMEHVATLGAPPLDEMERFIEQEGELAKNHPELGLDPDKPISKILRQMHLMDPGVEGQRGTHHGAFERGNTLLYEWLYKFVENGFTRNENEAGTILFELAEHKDESTYMMKLSMNLIELGVTPEELDPSNVTPGEEPEDEKEAMIARFFGMEQVNYNREWAKIEEHAFDPLQGLLEAEQFDYTYSSAAAIQNDTSPRDWPDEEYQ